jgi:hypothetical protein
MSALSLTKEVYRKIFTELISAIREDPNFQRELTRDQMDFIEQNWRKKMEESNIYLNQCQEINNILPNSRMVQYPYYNKAVSSNPILRDLPTVDL